jgi:hypothetical protein
MTRARPTRAVPLVRTSTRPRLQIRPVAVRPMEGSAGNDEPTDIDKCGTVLGVHDGLEMTCWSVRIDNAGQTSVSCDASASRFASRLAPPLRCGRPRPHARRSGSPGKGGLDIRAEIGRILGTCLPK